MSHSTGKPAFQLISLLFAAALLLLPAACQSKSKSGADTQAVSYAIPTELDVDLSSLITRGEAADTLGKPLQDGELFNAGTSIRYATQDLLSYVEIDMMSGDRELFDTVTANYADAADAPNLGEAAVWSAQAGQLLLLRGDCLLSITVVNPDMDSGARLMAARQLAALAVEKL